MRRRRKNGIEELIGSAVALLVVAVMIGGLSGGLPNVRSGIGAISMLVAGAAIIALGVGIFALFFKMFAGGNSPEGKPPVAPTPKQSWPLVVESVSRQASEDALDKLDWFQLEQLVAKLFEFKGNAAFPRGGANADGGIDLVVQLDSAKAAVQCKHWSKWKCGVGVVRELIGSMTHEGFTQGFLICRTATEEAKSLADSHKIRIIERSGLVNRVEDAIDKDDIPVKNALFRPQKLCPKCGSAMVIRTSSRGKKPGEEFWGCSTYPKCHQKLNI